MKKTKQMLLAAAVGMAVVASVQSEQQRVLYGFLWSEYVAPNTSSNFVKLSGI